MDDDDSFHVSPLPSTGRASGTDGASATISSSLPLLSSVMHLVIMTLRRRMMVVLSQLICWMMTVYNFHFHSFAVLLAVVAGTIVGDTVAAAASLCLEMSTGYYY